MTKFMTGIVQGLQLFYQQEYPLIHNFTISVDYKRESERQGEAVEPSSLQDPDESAEEEDYYFNEGQQQLQEDPDENEEHDDDEENNNKIQLVAATVYKGIIAQ